MDIFSQVDDRIRYCVEIDIFPYLLDHQFQGKAIMPAVEILITLAKTIKINYPHANVSCMSKAQFPRFLSIDARSNSLIAFIDIKDEDNGNITATLLTASKSKSGKINRMVKHACATFSINTSARDLKIPFHHIEKLAGECISISSLSIYRELVPFGKAYQNIVGDLSVSSEGALAYLSGGGTEADEDTLGSPFPFDATMHMACVWGQRFTDIVPFPVGFEKRIINRQTKKGGNYLGRVVPLNINNQRLIFDAWIYDVNGVLYESISSLEMRDVTQRQISPPKWIKE